MNALFLDQLDDLLTRGTDGLSQLFNETQVRFVSAQQERDGGFHGRQGPADLYYTDFALRTLNLLTPHHPALVPAAAYVENRTAMPQDIPGAFNLLNAGRILKRRGLETALDAAELGGVVLQHLLPEGGFSAKTEGESVSAYNSFLGALALQILGLQMPAPDGAARAILGLRREDGGFAESPPHRAGQTNATAAAVAFLLMTESFPQEYAPSTARFLAGMQAGDGGIRAHADARGGDLLSTFTGLLTLWMLGGMSLIDTAALAKFLRSLAMSGGGFRAHGTDGEADVEYTYYGIGTLALLRTSAGG